MGRARLLLFSLLLSACPKASERTGHVDLDDPRQCLPCHAEITREWMGSLHAHAAKGDPVYAAVLAARTAKEGPGLEAKCAPCHAPRPIEGLPELAGVGCATCHNSRGLAGQGVGVARLEPAPPATLLGPSDVREGVTTAHGTGAAAPHIKDGSGLCMACHEALANAQQVSLCATGLEWRAREGAERCAGCHMPRVAGAPTAGSPKTSHAAHLFLGPGRLRLPGGSGGGRAAGRARVALERAEGGVVAVLSSTAAHALPTGFPARVLELVVRGFDAAGKQVSTSSQALAKVYVDQEGKPVMGAYAARLAQDTRLQAGEVRRVPLTLGPGVRRVEAVLLDRLVGPALARLPGLAGSNWAAPVELGRAALALEEAPKR